MVADLGGEVDERCGSIDTYICNETMGLEPREPYSCPIDVNNWLVVVLHATTSLVAAPTVSAPTSSEGTNAHLFGLHRKAT